MVYRLRNKGSKIVKIESQNHRSIRSNRIESRLSSSSRKGRRYLTTIAHRGINRSTDVQERSIKISKHRNDLIILTVMVNHPV